MGVRLFDDNIDIYCDRLQHALLVDGTYKLEGCLAIQYVHVSFVLELKFILINYRVIMDSSAT